MQIGRRDNIQIAEADKTIKIFSINEKARLGDFHLIIVVAINVAKVRCRLILAMFGICLG